MPFHPETIASWPRGSDAFVEAFAKGLAVIAAFDESQGTPTMAELSKRTGLTRAGVRRLLLTLVALGFAKEHEGRYALTPRVARLGYAYLSSLTFREVAQPAIDALPRQCAIVSDVPESQGGKVNRKVLRGREAVGDHRL